MILKTVCFIGVGGFEVVVFHIVLQYIFTQNIIFSDHNTLRVLTSSACRQTEYEQNVIVAAGRTMV